MPNAALIRLETSKTEAGEKLGQEIIKELEKHFEACLAKGQIEPFALKLTTNVDNAIANAAMEYCARWTDSQNSNVIKDYVWMDSQQPDIIQQVQKLIASRDEGIIGGLISAFMPQAFIPRLIVETAIYLVFSGSDNKKRTERIIMFTPSAFHSYLRMPMRMYNVVGGYVTSVTSVATMATDLAGQGLTAATGLATGATELAGQGLGFVTSLFGKKSPTP